MGLPLPVPRVRDFCEVVVASFSRQEFRRHFRLQREVFKAVVGGVHTVPKLFMTGPSTGGRQPVSIEKRVLATLCMLATQECYRSMASRFGLSESTVHTSVRKGVRAIVRYLVPKLIVWPTGEAAERVLEGFEEKRGMQGVLGAIDGSQFPFKAPHMHQENYVCRKMISFNTAASSMRP